MTDQLTREQWLAKWPCHCTVCEGYGAQEWIEYHDGPRYPGEPMSEPCTCMDNGRCPRCGELSFSEDREPTVCACCGWDLDDPDFAPPAPETFPIPEEDC